MVLQIVFKQKIEVERVKESTLSKGTSLYSQETLYDSRSNVLIVKHQLPR